MKFKLIHLLMWLLGGYSLKHRRIEGEKVTNFLEQLGTETLGYKEYYTWRKKHILESMAIGVDEKTYWILCGRLMELQYVNGLSMKIIEREQKSLERANKQQYATEERSESKSN